MRRLGIYVGIVDFAAILILIRVLRNPTLSTIYLGLIAALILLIAELHPLNIFDEGDLTLGGLLQIVFLIVCGIEVVIIGVIVGENLFALIKKRPLIKTLFNSGQSTISIFCGYYTYLFIGGLPGQLMIESIIIPVMYILTNTLLVSIVLAIYHNIYGWQVFLMLNRDTLPYTTIITLGGLAFGGLIVSYRLIGTILSVILITCLWMVLYQAGQSISTIKVRFKQTISVLMTALEFRDPYTHGHSSRVAIMCRKIAEEMKLLPSEIENIELGGLMHDVGKVGVPDYILNKPGQLTKEEYEQVKMHTSIGHKILSEMDGMEYIANMARQHHLYYNGDPRGYMEYTPNVQTFIGSRILSVADAWDAMTGERPYRNSMSVQDAVREVLVNSGVQFDPEVVQAFINVLKNEGIYTESTTENERIIIPKKKENTQSIL